MRAYYERAAASHPVGSPRSVDWATEEAQQARLRVILAATAAMSPVSVCDLGCGLGAFRALARASGYPWHYIGVDIAQTMITRAASIACADPAARFVVGAEPLPADVVVASGIFNVRVNAPGAVWRHHVDTTLALMLNAATTGIAVNFLPPASGGREPSPHLHHEDPSRVVALLESSGCWVDVQTDYGPFDFTVIAQKEAP